MAIAAGGGETLVAERRRCTDCAFLTFFVCFWVGAFLIAGYAVLFGSLERLEFRADSAGNVCGARNDAPVANATSFLGVNARLLTAAAAGYYSYFLGGAQNSTGADLTSAKLLHFLDPYQTAATVAAGRAAVCVASCPTAVCPLGALPGACNASAFVCSYYGAYQLSLAPASITATAPPPPPPPPPCVNATAPANGTAAANGTAGNATAVACLAANTTVAVPANATAAGSASAPNGTSAIAGLGNGTVTGLGNGNGNGVSPWSTNYYASLSPAVRAASSVASVGPCFPVLLSTAPLLGYCVPLPAAANSPGANSSTNYSTSTSTNPTVPTGWVRAAVAAESLAAGRLTDYLGDLIRGWPILVVAGGACGTLLAGFSALLWRRAPAVAAWTAVMAANGQLWGVTLFCFAEAAYLGTSTAVGGSAPAAEVAYGPAEANRVAFVGVGAACGMLVVIVGVLSAVMLSRVKTALAVLRTAHAALSHVEGAQLVPLVPALAILGGFVYWLGIAVYLWTTQRLLPSAPLGSGYSTIYPLGVEFYYLLIYHTFGLVWGCHFLAAFTTMVVAGAVAPVYWCSGAPELMPRRPVLESVKSALQMWGTAAFGGLMSAVLGLPKVPLQMLERGMLLVAQEATDEATDEATHEAAEAAKPGLTPAVLFPPGPVTEARGSIRATTTRAQRLAAAAGGEAAAAAGGSGAAVVGAAGARGGFWAPTWPVVSPWGGGAAATTPPTATATAQGGYAVAPTRPAVSGTRVQAPHTRARGWRGWWGATAPLSASTGGQAKEMGGGATLGLPVKAAWAAWIRPPPPLRPPRSLPDAPRQKKGGCLGCLGGVVRLSGDRPTYVLAAFRGGSFSRSSADAGDLIAANAVAAASVGIVSDFLTGLTKLAVGLACALIALLMAAVGQGYTDPASASYLSSPMGPAAVAGFLGLALANVALSVTEAAVETVMMCYCEDRRRHGEAAFASPLLRATLGAPPPRQTAKRASGTGGTGVAPWLALPPWLTLPGGGGAVAAPGARA